MGAKCLRAERGSSCGSRCTRRDVSQPSVQLAPVLAWSPQVRHDDGSPGSPPSPLPETARQPYLAAFFAAGLEGAAFFAGAGACAASANSEPVLKLTRLPAG